MQLKVRENLILNKKQNGMIIKNTNHQKATIALSDKITKKALFLNNIIKGVISTLIFLLIIEFSGSQYVQAQTCSGTTPLTASLASFDDGSGINDYSSNADCFWLIQPTGATSVQLTFTAFDTETGYDLVDVYDGNTVSAPSLGSFSGSNLPPVINSTGGSILIHFTTDSSVEQSGWGASYTSNGGGGGGNSPVANFSTSTVNITEGDSVSFADLSTNAPTSWSWTFTGGLPATSSGKDPMNIVYSIAGCYTVELIVANGSGSDTKIKTCYINVSVTGGGGGSSCSGITNLTAAAGTFDDGSGTIDYGDNSDCKWLIQPSGSTSISLNFSSFDTESGYDFVTVYDGPSVLATQLGTFSGGTIPGTVTSTGGAMLLHFTSDGSATAMGWAASYTSTNSGGGPVVTAVSPTTVVAYQQTTFTVYGSNLISGMGFSIADVVNISELSGGSATERYFQGTPVGSPGTMAGEVRDASGGTLLYSFNVTIPATQPPSNSVQIGLLTVNANTVTNNTTNVFQVSGDVNINSILYFDGDITVNKSNMTISGNCKIYMPGIFNQGEVDLYQGPFDFSVQNDILNAIVTTQINHMFKLAGLNVKIKKMKMLADGIRITGKLKLPEVMNHYQVQVTTLQITQSAGIDLVGNININNIGLSNGTAELKNLSLSFNTISDKFTGSAKLGVMNFEVGASVTLVGGSLSALGASVAPSSPVSIPATGFSISQLSGSVGGLNVPPLELNLACKIVPTLQGSFDIVELNNVGLQYRWAQSLKGTAGLKIFNHQVVNVFVEVTGNNIMIGGKTKFGQVLDGTIAASMYWGSGEINFEGTMLAKLYIPNGSGFPYDQLNSVINLPYQVAQTDNFVKNSIAAGNTTIAYFDLHYLLEWNGTGFVSDFGTGYVNWNDVLFGGGKKSRLLNNNVLQAMNRFEGRSLIINNSNSQIKPTGLTEMFNLQTATPAMIVRVQDSTGMPQCEVVLPDGSIVTPQTVGQYANTFYSENTIDNKAFFTFKHPVMGMYEVNVPSTNGNIYLDVIGAEMPSVILLDSLQNNGSSTIIRWDDSDPDSDAMIDLYYDNDNSGANGVKIISSISEDEIKDEHTWLRTNIPTGEYYIYAVMTDTNHAPVVAYSPNSVMHIAAGAPSAPINLVSIQSDTSITLKWTNTNSISMRYNVYVAEDGENPDYSSQAFNIGMIEQFEFKNFVPGKEYRFFVTAVDSLFNESGISNIVVVNYISSTLNNVPSILPQTFPTVAFVNVAYSHLTVSNEPDGENMTFKLLDAPVNMTIGMNNGLILWTPDNSMIGLNYVKVLVSDPAGLSDSVEFYITVFENTDNMVYVGLNKAGYYCYGDIGVVTVTDFSLFNSSNVIDEVLVKVYSGADTNGITLTAVETQPNSNTYTAAFVFDEFSSGNGSLKIDYNDVVNVKYTSSGLQSTFTGEGLFQNVPVNVSIISNGIIDTKDSVILSTNEVFTSYLWSTGSTDNALSISDVGAYSVIVSNQAGCIASAIIEVSPTGINDLQEDIIELSVFPNPTTGLVNVEICNTDASSFIIEAMAVTGDQVFRKVFDESSVSKTAIDLSHLPAGGYFVIVRTNNSINMIKVIVL